MNKPLGWFSHSRDIEILILSEACSPGWYGEDCVEGYLTVVTALFVTPSMEAVKVVTQGI